jgi:hypothetical protein
MVIYPKKGRHCEENIRRKQLEDSGRDNRKKKRRQCQRLCEEEGRQRKRSCEEEV